MTDKKDEQKEWKIGDKYIMYPIGIDFIVKGIIQNKEQLEKVKMFDGIYKHDR